MPIKYRTRKGTEAEWLAKDPVLDEGEIGTVTDTGEIVVGDGSTAFASLERFSPTVGNATYLSHGDAVMTALPWAGGYYAPQVLAVAATGFGDGQLRASPIEFPSPRSIDRIGVEITSAGPASSVARLGIYTGNFQDGFDLLFDAGTVAADSTGVKEITIAETLPPGIYWLAAVGQGGSIGFRANTLHQMNAAAALTSAGLVRDGWLEVGVSGALPATLLEPGFSGVNTTPRVIVRMA